MEHQRFDRLARLLAASLDRRRHLAALLGVAAVSAAPAVDAPAAPDARRRRPGPAGPCGKRGNDNACERNSDCCTGFCKKMKSGPNRCRCIKRNKKCSPNQTCCGALVCRDKRCSSPVEPETCVVCASGCAYTTVEAAIAAAADGAVIPIAAGTYPTPPITLSKSVTLKACDDVSGVILSKVAASDTYMLQDEDGTDATREVVLNGLTFQGTDADSYGLTQANGSSNWTVTNCTFRYSSYAWYGNGGNATFTGCTFSGINGLGSGIGSDLAADKADVIIENCTFSGGLSGVYLSVDSPIPAQNSLIISNSTVTGNSDGGIYFGASTNARLTGCTVTGNGQDGGVVLQTGTLTITDTTISGNSASYGGGVGIRQTSTLILGSGVVITQNTAPDGSGIGALANNSSVITVTGASNSNVFGNIGGDQCEKDSGSGFVVVPNCAF